jgi:hypothetical protein
MAKQNQPVETLMSAREKLVAQRRHLAAALAEGYKRGHTEKMTETFLTQQSAIEAIDRAIADERRIAAGEQPIPMVAPIVARSESR